MKSASPRADDEIRIGVSTCLLGDNVRFDGGHKRSSFLTETLARFVRFVPVCPEMEIGLGVPREAIHLRREGSALRLVGARSGTDHTAAMTRWSAARVERLVALDLSGYVFKKDSPSCGLERVVVHLPGSAKDRTGRGLFAAALTERMPLLPCEEEGRLLDPRQRENFIERVFAYRRLQTLFAERWSTGDLVRFHTAEKLLLLAHDRAGYDALGRLVASASGQPRGALVTRYAAGFMTALGKLATPGRHANVLQHMAGFLKRSLDAAERAELAQVIEDFRKSLTPLVVPITLLRHHARRHRVDYLLGQTYLDPHPKELALRNHV